MPPSSPTQAIADRAAVPRRHARVKLAGAIILATALMHALTLVTRNTRDRAASGPAIYVPYTL